VSPPHPGTSPQFRCAKSSARTTMGVPTQPVAPERIRMWGAPVRCESAGTDPERAGNFFWSCPSTLLALTVQLVVLVSTFVIVNTVRSVSCLLFFYSRCPPPCAQPFVKVGHSTLYGRPRAFAIAGPSARNSLPDPVSNLHSTGAAFRRLLKTFPFARYYRTERSERIREVH